MVVFVKPKTAYELRISDWSSDVCSSDLLPRALDDAVHGAAEQADAAAAGFGDLDDGLQARHVAGEAGDGHPVLEAAHHLQELLADIGLGAGVAPYQDPKSAV